MLFDGKSKAVPRMMLPACCDITSTLDRLRPDALARPDLYLRFRCPVNYNNDTNNYSNSNNKNKTIMIIIITRMVIIKTRMII